MSEENPKPDELKKEPPASYKKLSFYVSLLLTLSVIMSLLNSWEVRYYVNGIVYSMTSAGFNKTQAEILSESQARQNYTLYSYYMVNDGLQQNLGRIITDFEAPGQATQVQLYDQANLLASNNRYFFPGRYLKPDGSYDFQRNVDETYAEMSQRLDTDPDGHRAAADEQLEHRRKVNLGIVVLALSFALFSFERLFYWERRSIRYLLLGVGIALLVAGIVNYIQLDPDPLLQLKLK